MQKIEGKEYCIPYSGLIVTNNDAKSLHWTKLRVKVNEQKKTFAYLIKQAKIPHIEKYEIIVKANTRHDLDNLSMTIKTFLDTMKKLGCIVDDSAHYCKSVHISRDTTLEKKHLKIIIKKL